MNSTHLSQDWQWEFLKNCSVSLPNSWNSCLGRKEGRAAGAITAWQCYQQCSTCCCAQDCGGKFWKPELWIRRKAGRKTAVLVLAWALSAQEDENKLERVWARLTSSKDLMSPTISWWNGLVKPCEEEGKAWNFLALWIHFWFLTKISSKLQKKGTLTDH